MRIRPGHSAVTVTPVALDLLVEALAEAEDVGLRGGVDREVRPGLVGGDAGHVEQPAAAARHHRGQGGVRQAGQRPDVEAHLLVQAVGVGLVERPAGPEPGVVDDQVDRPVDIADAGADGVLAATLVEVGDQHLDAGQFVGQCPQPIRSPSDHHDRHAGRGQLACQLLTDPAGGTGDQRRGERVRRSGSHRTIVAGIRAALVSERRRRATIRCRLAGPNWQDSRVAVPSRMSTRTRNAAAAANRVVQRIRRGHLLSSPPRGLARFGAMRRLRPVSEVWGYDRGTPVDRWYIQDFLRRFGQAPATPQETFAAECSRWGRRVRHCAGHSRRPGRDDFDRCAPRHGANPKATVVGDLVTGEGIPVAAYDCIICTQTLHVLYDLPSAVRNLHSALRCPAVWPWSPSPGSPAAASRIATAGRLLASHQPVRRAPAQRGLRTAARARRGLREPAHRHGVPAGPGRRGAPTLAAAGCTIPSTRSSWPFAPNGHRTDRAAVARPRNAAPTPC